MCDFFFFKQKPAYEMRISDWSSDVCSSDLLPHVISQARDGLLVESERIGADPGDVQCHGMIAIAGQHLVCRALGSAVVAGGQLDRKSVGSGKSASVRVDLGGRRIINKKKKDESTNTINQ